MPNDHLDEGAPRRLGVQGGRGHQRDHPAGSHDPRHLAHRRRPVREEHQRHLAHHPVEGAVRERQRLRIALPPVQVGADPFGDRQHGPVQVQAGDVSLRADPVGGGAGENAGTASHVENLLPRHEAGGIGNGRRPIGEQGGDESLLVDLGDPERYLESLTGCRKCPIGVGHDDHLLH
jgi:hypothetical protein